MSIKDRSKRIVAGGAGALGLTLGVAALAGATTSPTQQPAPQTADQEAQDPNLNGSIQTPEDESASEAKALEALAKISTADAEQAALAATPGGTVLGSALENDNGSVVYEVDMTDVNGKAVEVKVDAGNGTVLAQENDESESDDESETDEANEAPEADEAPDVTPAG